MLAMLTQAILQLALTMLLGVDLLFRERQCFLGALAILLERGEPRCQRFESVFDAVRAKVFCLHLEQRGYLRIHVVSSKVIFERAWLQTMAIGARPALVSHSPTAACDARAGPSPRRPRV